MNGSVLVERENLHLMSLELYSLSAMITDLRNPDETTRKGLGIIINNVSDRLDLLTHTLPVVE